MSDQDDELEKLLEFDNQLNSKNDNLNEKTKNVDKHIKNIKSISNLKNFKTEFIFRLQSRIEKLNRRLIIVELKYYDYKKYYDGFSLFIICLSAFLTIFEAIKNDINIENQEPATRDFLKITPIVISTLIGLIAAVIKFKKYQDIMENIARSIEKSIFTTFRMKKLKEEIYYMNNEDMEKTKQIYLEEIFTLYNQTQAELEKNIGFTDIIKYTNKKNKSNINAYIDQLKLYIKKKNINNKYIKLGLENTEIESLEVSQALEDLDSTESKDDCKSIKIDITEDDTTETKFRESSI
jgi:hypothetical protein